MYKGKYLNTGAAPKAAPVPTAQELSSEELLQQTQDEHKEAVKSEPVYQSPEVPEKPAPKKSRKGSIIFYSIYFTFVIAAVVAIFMLISPLKEWLINYEASQPETMCQQVYDQYFAKPDWKVLYTLAGLEDTKFEGEDAYASYMSAKVADATDPTLECQETSAGLSGNHKYLIKLDGEKIACFTLNPTSDTQSAVTGWELGEVELFFTRNESVTVELLPGQTVTVNGVALDNNYIVRTTSTKVESYLPEGLHGYRSQQMTVSDLLIAPEVAVTDENGASIPLVTDSETGILKATGDNSAMQIPADREETAKIFAEQFAKYAIRTISSDALARYMDSKSQCFRDVIYTAPFLQGFHKYEVNDIILNDYYAYSDELFSVRIALTMDVHANKGNIKHFEMDTTFFFQKKNGKFLVVDKTNVDVTETVEQVRLTFINDGAQLDSFMVDSSTNKVATPQVTAPTGKVLKGWAVQSIGENGSIEMSIMLTPDENGTALVSQDLEPMVLYPVFEVA